MGRTQARYEEGTTAKFGGILRDDARLAIPFADLNELTLTLIDAKSGSVINSRNAQDVKNTNNVVVDTGTSGSFEWTIQKNDLTPLDSTASYAEHVATLKWRYRMSLWGEHEHRLAIRNFTSLCTFQDVAEYRRGIDAAEILLVESMIDAVSLRIEQETGRLFRLSTIDTPTTETFSIYSSGAWSLPLKRYPVSSIVSVKEESEGNFDDPNSLIDATDYALNYDKSRIEMRYYPFTPGRGSVQIKYAGGLARDPGGVPFDLRMATARQVAYWHQNKDKIGQLSVSVGGMSQSLRMEQDFLQDVKSVIDQYGTVYP